MLLTGLAFLAAGARPAAAQTTFVATRAAIGANDLIDWSGIGPDFTVAPNPFSISSNGGLGASVSQAGGAFVRLTQDSSVGGNFGPGDAVLFTGGNNGPVTIEFATPVFAAGAQFQTDFIGDYTARIEAFDAGGGLLGSFDFAGVSGSSFPGDNTAVFAGVSNPSAVIKSIRYTGLTAVSSPNQFVINQVSLRVIPEPASLTLLGAGLLPLGLKLRRRKAQTPS
jgi:hypothetical protein